ncbi:MAG: class I SAM-dependent methyltransferase [Pirellulales bacterium]|nr:class I SAM-dependent methyltransferase [Pirellulales bacterium]|tara:strand:+ start:659 stop:1507 length:849 start_codon:yes stop_codon:yes gene_type:complete
MENGSDSSVSKVTLLKNAAAWDRLAKAHDALASPACDEAFTDPRNWLGTGGPADRPWLPSSLRGLEVLCLAAGGGKHGPIYAAAGASVTVVDLSASMLDLDRQVARERKLHLELIQSSMDELTMLKNDYFDLVIHPVSSCYLPTLKQVFSEIVRVCRPGGLYMSQHKSPRSLQSSLQPNLNGRYELLFPECQSGDNSGALPPAPPSRLREAGTDEFVHSLTDILGGICRAGFSIEDFFEPNEGDQEAVRGSFTHRAAFLPPYIRILARKYGQRATLQPVVVQ